VQENGRKHQWRGSTATSTVQKDYKNEVNENEDSFVEQGRDDVGSNLFKFKIR